jgi:hypothetical protein
MSGEFWIDTVSFAAGIQAYSDKSSQSLRAGSKSFLPLHLSPLNHNEGFEAKADIYGDTIVAHLPVDLVKADDQWEIDVEKGLADGEEGQMKVRRRA